MVESSVAKPQPSPELAAILQRSAELEQQRQIELARQAMKQKEAELDKLKGKSQENASTVQQQVDSIV